MLIAGFELIAKAGKIAQQLSKKYNRKKADKRSIKLMCFFYQLFL